ncbi:MAG: nucleotide exchange factor GrpE [Pseudomonadota bacterium]
MNEMSSKAKAAEPKPDEAKDSVDAKPSNDAGAAAETAQEAAALEGVGGPSDMSNETLAFKDDASSETHVAALEIELAETKDRLMRAAADLQNLRKRAERDRRDAEVYGGTKLARDILPVYDNLKQAIALASDELREKEAGFFNGIDLTLKELVNGFAKHKITPIHPDKGERFDPHQHQAMFEAPVPGAPAGTVIEVMATGFMIADKLLRPAMVGVAKGGAPVEPTSGKDAEDTAAEEGKSD